MAWGECQRCGFKRDLRNLCKEWTGLRVCADKCKDPRPADHRPPVFKPEGVILPNAAPATEPVYRAPGDKGNAADL